MEAPVDAEFLKLAKDAGAYYCPTITVIDGYAKLPAAARSGIAPAVDDPMGAVDSLTRAHVEMTPGEARRVMGASPRLVDSVMAVRHRFMDANLRAVRRAGIPIATGTDAGNPLTLHGPAIFAEMEAMQRAGMTPIEVLRASTRDAARATGRGDELGTIEKGKSADLLILASDPRRDVAAFRKLEVVMRSGVARTTDELRAAVAKTRW
jgi:imidazolonepropionase-like amidohydrolase